MGSQLVSIHIVTCELIHNVSVLCVCVCVCVLYVCVRVCVFVVCVCVCVCVYMCLCVRAFVCCALKKMEMLGQSKSKSNPSKT